jgi:hypothetical protein
MLDLTPFMNTAMVWVQQILLLCLLLLVAGAGLGFLIHSKGFAMKCVLGIVAIMAVDAIFMAFGAPSLIQDFYLLLDGLFQF